ncbi:hypothetical protein, partial [Desulfobacula sp.]|uniref:hypothetical protein n=1 Tax=Desulfobacula sp. TaxID=2593537 RepID=UPI0039B936FC
WNYTYHSRDSWENYHYKGLRLGYPFSSSEEIKLKIGYWGFKKMLNPVNFWKIIFLVDNIGGSTG